MLLQSKSASRLWIDSNYNEQDLVTTSRKTVPTVNNILPTMNYTCWRKKGTAWWNNGDQEWFGVSKATKIVLTQHRKKSCYVEVQRHPEHQSRSYTSKRSWRGKKYLTKIQSCHDVTFPRSGELKVLSL
jgi:hypothetical protein